MSRPNRIFDISSSFSSSSSSSCFCFLFFSSSLLRLHCCLLYLLLFLLLFVFFIQLFFIFFIFFILFFCLYLCISRFLQTIHCIGAVCAFYLSLHMKIAFIRIIFHHYMRSHLSVRALIHLTVIVLSHSFLEL